MSKSFFLKSKLLFLATLLLLNSNVGFVRMNGKEVFKHAVEKLSSCLLEAINSANLKIQDIEKEIQLLSDIRIEGSKNNLDVSSVNIVTGKEGATISNQIVLLSQLREEIKTKQKLLEPLVFVQDFLKLFPVSWCVWVIF